MSHEQITCRNDVWIFLWSLLLGGINVNLDGRTPVVLYFDVVIVLWLAYQVFWRGFWPSFSGSIVRLGGFCLIWGMLVALVNYQDIYKSLAILKILACGLLVYVIVRKVQPGLLTLSLWGAVVGVLLLAHFQTIRNDPFEGDAGLKDMVGISIGRSNYVASLLLLLIPFAVAGIVHSQRKVRILFAGCTMLMFAGLIATMSRGAMLAFVLAVVLSLPLLYRAGLRAKHVLLFSCISAVTILLLPSDLLTADAALIAYRWENPDLGRQEVMEASLECIKENPWMGVGPGQLGRAIASHMVVPDYDQQYMNGHNLVLNSFAENGLPGGLALLAMVAIVLYRAFKASVLNPTALNLAIWVALLAAVVHNMVEPSFEGQHFQVLFWTVSAMAETKGQGRSSLGVGQLPSANSVNDNYS